ncbi:uncharacterized protein BDW47DRAFT_124807 [Aspergillus candidus]|uniref:CWH43-like N-terminal domain-containing protein n=1 Tax=Aspergillus candidus TaxID=41067 RepID=A0A2I2FEW3_ASPCN|nr:hypothetical protein BDW47DRAFT_124807 [Aspergillus candidus]PLB39182.1 hypothetical protein BDW47DRAFT_124807 [Aspergillus candidus]
MIESLLIKCHNAIWSLLHAIILDIPPTRLPLFPALAGSVWFLTLASLLLTWIARGMPRYPGQSNPHVAFISDIASFELKPLFLIGTSMTAVGFLLTVAAVHVVYYEPGFALARARARARARDTPVLSPQLERALSNDAHAPSITTCSSTRTQSIGIPEEGPQEFEEREDDPTTRTLKLISLLAILAASTASTALILLGVMDTFRYKTLHHFFLRLCFAGLAIQSTCTAIVYADEVLDFVAYLCHGARWQSYTGKRNPRVRVFASLSTALILVELTLGVVFLSLIVPDDAQYRTAGILEWVIAFLGTVYLWLFCGFLDSATLETLVPSALYISPEQGRLSIPGEGGLAGSVEGQGNRVEGERAPLLHPAVNRKYT